MSKTIQCLDHGYVRRVDWMGTDLSVVNAARASFEKESLVFGESDERLLAYLWRRNETSPFRHGVMTYEVYAPLMIARQWWKYVVGSDHTLDAWNESSRRYVTEEPVYYSPTWRGAPDNRKQGSGGVVDMPWLTARLAERHEQSIRDYDDAIADGVAPEQARVFLLAYGLYVRWRWTASIQSILHYLDQRLEEGAQSEMWPYATAVRDMTLEIFPKVIDCCGLV